MISKELEITLNVTLNEALRRRHEYVTLEHLLFALLHDQTASNIIRHCGGDVDALKIDLEKFFTEKMPAAKGRRTEIPEQTKAFQSVLQYALLQAEGSGRSEIDGGNVLAALFTAEQSHAVYLLKKQGLTRLDVLKFMSHGISKLTNDFGISPGDAGIAGDEDQGPQQSRDPLAAYTINLNERAAKGLIDPVIGRSVELLRTIQVLCRRRKNNPIYVGEPGVGKTAIAEGLARNIHHGQVPEALREAKIFALDMGAVLAGTKYRGEFEQRFKGVIAALQKVPHSILFIDEIHTIVGAGAVSGGSMDASNILKPALASGELRCIGSTTYAEYKSAFERDRALARRFQKIEVGEPTIEESVQILQGLKSYYEEHHGVKYSDEALRASVELSAKHIHERFLPDKALDVVDEVGAAVKLMTSEERPSIIGVAEVEAVVARMAKIPTKSVASSEKDRLRNLDVELRSVIYGQDHAIEKVVRAIKLARAGLSRPDKPVGSFLFSGPTGVGKTELAKQLSLALGVEFIRFDMSEYAEPHTVSRLIGAPPGYVGFDQGGLLTDAVTRTPYAVLVLDEIEKAHPNLFNLLLQVMDHATLTDNNGKKADFRHVILIMTTNVGARELSEGGIGFQNNTGKGLGRGSIERAFSPEFRNRLDAWIAFNALDFSVIENVVDKFIKQLNAQLKEKAIRIELTTAARAWLAHNGYDKNYGARPMERLIQSKINEPLAEKLLFDEAEIGNLVVIDEENGELLWRMNQG
ncbi:MAG: ATP-dependent Clp protease ATP-binding subunit ClpA [Pyrinomonadaceae bacterium]